jgi:hypothetical protein
MKAHSRFLKGQILVLFTLALPVLLGVMAMGADFAIIYLNWAMVQKAADAAALAGASQLTGVPGSASSLTSAADNYVNGYACMNGVSDPDSISTNPVACAQASHPEGFADKIVFTNVTDTQVSVGIKRSVPYFFGKMIGLQEASVAAKATAAINPPGTVPQGLFPVGLECQAPCDMSKLLSGNGVSTFGSKFVLNTSNNLESASPGAPGNWDWIDVGQGQGATELGTVLQNGSTSSFSISDTVNTSPGVGKYNGAPVDKGFSNRLAKCSVASPDPCSNGGALPSGFNCKDPCLINVPVVDFSGCSGNCSMQIEGFAQMYIEPATSTVNAINVCFVKGTDCQAEGGGTGAPNLGSLSPPVLIN